MSYMNEYGDGGQVSEAMVSEAMDVVARTGIGYGDHGQISEAADVAARSGIAASIRPAGSEQSARATTGGAMAGESAQRRLAQLALQSAPEERAAAYARLWPPHLSRLYPQRLWLRPQPQHRPSAENVL